MWLPPAGQHAHRGYTHTHCFPCVTAAGRPPHPLLQVLNVSLQFFEAQQSGRLPRISNVPWRSNSAVFDSVMMAGNRNVSLTGGW